MFIGYALLIASMLLYFATVGGILPQWLLRPQYAAVHLDARGLRRCLYNGKRCVVYERCVNQRRYISRYLLCQGEGCKLFQCQVTASVRSMVYDVVLFDRYDHVFDVMHVKEDFASPYSKMLSLPDETSYVSIRLRKVNKTAMEVKPMTFLPRNSIFVFSLCTFLLSLVEGLVIMTGCAYAFGGVFREDFLKSPENILIGIGVSLGTVLIGLIVVSVAVRRRMKV